MKPFYINKFIYGVVLMGLAASCSTDALDSFRGDGTVTFTANIPEEITRAYGGGTLDKQLTYIVFDKSNQPVETGTVSMTGKSTDVKLTLAEGVDYRIVFWAAHASAPYSLNTDTGVLTVNYAEMTPNSDTNDAFYTAIDFEGGSESGVTVNLTRPFAQLNFATDDLDAEVVRKSYPDNVYTSIAATAYTQFNLRTDEMVGEMQEIDIPRGTVATMETEPFFIAHATPGRTYKYAGLAYILCPAENATSDLKLIAYKAGDKSAEVTRVEVPNAPVRRNYRTNIYGSLLTSTTNFNVTISPDFKGTAATDFKNLQEIINASNDNITITIPKPKEGESTENQVLVIKDAPTERVVNLEVADMTPPKVEAGENVKVNIYANTDKFNLETYFGSPSQVRGRRTSASTGQAHFHAKAGSDISVYGGVYAGTSAELFAVETGGSINVYDGIFIDTTPETYAPEGYHTILDPASKIAGHNVYYVYKHNLPTRGAEFAHALNNAQSGEVVELHKSFDLYTTAHDVVITKPNITLRADHGVVVNFVVPVKYGMTQPYKPNIKDAIQQYLPQKTSFTINPGAGLTIEGDGTYNFACRGFKVDGDMTINGGTFTSSIIYDYNIIYNASGNLTINGGRLLASAVAVNNYSKFTLNGGYLDGNYAYTVKAASPTSDITINGGEIHGLYGALSASHGTWEIKGGVLSSRRGVSENFYALYSDGYMYGTNGKISGGYFYSEGLQHSQPSGVVMEKRSVYITTDSDVEITGGYFRNQGYFGPYNEFTLDSEYLTVPVAEGYEWKATGDTPYAWTVVKSTAPAAKKRHVAKHTAFKTKAGKQIGRQHRQTSGSN